MPPKKNTMLNKKLKKLDDPPKESQKEEVDQSKPLRRLKKIGKGNNIPLIK